MTIYIATDFPTLIKFVARVNAFSVFEICASMKLQLSDLFTIIYLHLHHFRIDFFSLS